MNKIYKQSIIILLIVIAINFLSNLAYERFDLTADSRYTLSDATIKILEKASSPLIIDVFLEGDDFPSEFRRLQSETRQLLEEFATGNKNIIFNFVNPLEEGTDRERNIQSLTQRGLTPMQLNVTEKGKSSTAVIFPWALASYNDQTVKIPLIKNKIGASQQELVSNSVQHLEYALADGINKLTKPKSKRIAVLKGNQQLKDQYIADLLKTLNEYYYIAQFTLDSVSTDPQKTLNKLESFDLIINAKPTEAFTENEKFVLDQFTMDGGKSLWLLDAVAMEKDSLYESGSSFAVNRELNLTDFFFKYGVRINPVLVSTMYSAPITLAMGEGSNSQFQNLRWPYSPLASSSSGHPIVNNIDLVRFDFASQIDTLKNDIIKTVLLESAPLSKMEGTPREINLDIVTKDLKPDDFDDGNLSLAVLLEGEFTSVYNNRIKPFDLSGVKIRSAPTKMIIISDGDIIKNDVIRNVPQELGFDRWTGQNFGNKEFLLNSINYLLDDTGLINIRSKEISVAFLDQQKVAKEKTKWQLLNILLPLALLLLFGLTFNYMRKKKYAR